MTTQSQVVLIFGATGAVGCAAAIEAHRRGAKVWLAMRDTNKPIKGLSEKDLKSGRYQQIEADLLKPETVKYAVTQSGAEAAFVYTIFESEDSMQGTFTTLKEAGIEHVVLLSSYSVKGPAGNEENMQDLIRGVHAKAEVALEKSGASYTALRPMYFDTNLFWYQDGIRKGEVGLFCPDMKLDYIAPTDIGTVCGAVLAEPNLRAESKQIIPLCGPELMRQRDAMTVISTVLGKDIKVKELDEEAWYAQQSRVLPRPVIDSITQGMKESAGEKDMFLNYSRAAANSLRLTGREATTLKQWMEENKAAFM